MPLRPPCSSSNNGERREAYTKRQANHEGEAQIEEWLVQLKSEHMRIAELLIMDGHLLQVRNGHSEGKYQQVSRQLVKLHEEVEEFGE